MVAESLVALTILTLLLGGMAVAQDAARKSNAFQWARQRCLAAAQAQLDALSAQGRPAPQEEIGRLWPGVRTGLSAADGQGQWQGLTLVTVTARGQADGREVKVEMARYYNRPVGVQP
jgi:type II secretory pathway pseudopilin PulG